MTEEQKTKQTKYNETARIKRHAALDALGLPRCTKGKIADLQAAHAAKQNGSGHYQRPPGMFRQLGIEVKTLADGRFESVCRWCPHVVNRRSPKAIENDMVRHVRDAHPDEFKANVTPRYRPQRQSLPNTVPVEQHSGMRCPECGCDIIAAYERLAMKLKAAASIKI